jgi:uncharacterized protein
MSGRDSSNGLHRLFNGLIVVAISLSAFVMEPPRQAQAQERRTILDMLFGFGRRQAPPPVYDDEPIYEPRQRQQQQQLQPQQRPKIRKTQQKPKPVPAEPAPVVVEKL